MPLRGSRCSLALALLSLVAGIGDQTFTLFGRVPAGQHLLAGEYEDSLVLTLSF